MQLLAVQFDIKWEDKPANFAKVRTLIESARLEPDALVVLPEMFATGFSMNVDTIAEADGGATEQFLKSLAIEFSIYATGGVVKKSLDGVRGLNQSVTFSPGGELVARYSKIHPFTFGTESDHYVGGRELLVFDAGDARVCPVVCYDLRFPELFREGVSRGSTLFTVIANWPAAREAHWVTLLQARAIENQAYVVGVNRCGRDPKLAYSGRSLIVDPRGNIVSDAGCDEGVIEAEFDAAGLGAYRAEFPALRDRRWPFP